MFDIKIFRFDDCPREAFEFRYKIYVEEMGRPQTYADHKSKTIIDPLDKTAYHGVAFCNGEIAGVIRLNFLKEAKPEPYFSLYNLGELSPEKQNETSICTRYMVASKHRGSLLAYRMLKEMYLLALWNGSTACFFDVNKPLIWLYEKIGCRQVFERTHPDYGSVTIMRLDGLDIAHLKAKRSPFARVCERFLSEERTGLNCSPSNIIELKDQSFSRRRSVKMHSTPNRGRHTEGSKGQVATWLD